MIWSSICMRIVLIFVTLFKSTVMQYSMTNKHEPFPRINTFYKHCFSRYKSKHLNINLYFSPNMLSYDLFPLPLVLYDGPTRWMGWGVSFHSFLSAQN